MPRVSRTRPVKPEIDNQFGEFLAKARKEKGMTLNEVAENLGLRSPQPVWDWENGKGSGVPTDTLLKLVKIYGISIEEAYDHLMRFHQTRVRFKIHAKFEQARMKVFGKK